MEPARPPTLTFDPLGDCALRAGFADAWDERTVTLIRSWCAALGQARIGGVIEWVPAWTSVTITYNPRTIRYAELCAVLSSLAVQDGAGGTPGRRLVIPVTYGGEAGPDLPVVAERAGMSVEQVVQRHSAPGYRVVMIGFAPGFPYLSGLDPALRVPRLDRPRPLVRAGSVGIGGEQTGVYSIASPGGWRIIGWTPVPLFDPAREPSSLLAAGDEVRFVPADGAACAAIERTVSDGAWKPAWETPA